MPSAKTVAQKPVGNFRPLSLSGHGRLLDAAPASDCFLACIFWARIKETPTQIVASATRAYEKVFLITIFRIAYIPFRTSPRPPAQDSRLPSSIDPAAEAFYPTRVIYSN